MHVATYGFNKMPDNKIIIAIVEWINSNQGIVSLLVFFTTIFLGWVSGIFSALRRKPKFKIELIPGPTFCCTFFTGKKHGHYDVHRTGIALYLIVSNVGSAPSSIANISIGYHWNLNPFSKLWIKNTIGWFWLHEQTVVLADFQTSIGDSTKYFPFLIQHSLVSGISTKTFLDVGRSLNGVVYFEQDDSWGGCSPVVHNHNVLLKINVRDVFGNSHYAKFMVPAVTLEEAQKFNPKFGETLATIQGV